MIAEHENVRFENSALKSLGSESFGYVNKEKSWM